MDWLAAGGVTVDKILGDPELKARCRALMDETITAANALGHHIEKQYADLQIERTYPMGAYQPSTLVDWLAGRELEIETMWESHCVVEERLSYRSRTSRCSTSI